jgi:DNA-binding transcriptional ArsR family regulator
MRRPQPAQAAGASSGVADHGENEEAEWGGGNKDALFEQFARVGKALASPKRLELVDLLAQGERTVESLARAANLGMTTCSAHLQTLKQARLVATRKDGVKVHYRLAGPDVAALYAHLRRSPPPTWPTWRRRVATRPR